MLNQSKSIKIQNRLLGYGHLPYCIAEVGINHNGSLEKAIQMISIAKKAGVDAIKFQTFRAKEFCGDPNQLFKYKSQGKIVIEPMLKMFKRYELNRKAWFEIKKECNRKNIVFLSTPQNMTDLKILLKVGVSVVKVGSDDLTNLPLLKNFQKTNLPLILSCGMSNIAEVHNALEAVGWYKGKPIVMLLCTSQYPTPPKDVNIQKLTTLRKAFPGLIVGFSDHTQDSLAASLAVALGATVFEKHFTLSHDLEGPDHWFSCDPEELKEWVKDIHKSYEMMGSPYLKPTFIEQKMSKIARRSITAIKKIPVGEILKKTNIGARRPGGGLPIQMIDKLIGLRAVREIPFGKIISLKDLNK